MGQNNTSPFPLPLAPPPKKKKKIPDGGAGMGVGVGVEGELVPDVYSKMNIDFIHVSSVSLSGQPMVFPSHTFRSYNPAAGYCGCID